MRVRVFAILVVGLVVLAAGCGGASKKSSSSATASTATSATTSTTTKGYGAATTSGATTTQSTKTSTPTFASVHNCAQLAALGAEVAKSLQATAGNLQATVANEAKALQAMASAAPSQIRGDFETFTGAFNNYVQALAKAGLKPGSVPSPAQVAQLAAAGKAFSTARLQAAEQHLSAWAQTNCTKG